MGSSRRNNHRVHSSTHGNIGNTSLSSVMSAAKLEEPYTGKESLLTD
jgi:hypothetical protein